VHQLEQYDQQLLLSLTSIQEKQIQEKKYHLLLTQLPSLLLALHTQHAHELLMPYILDAFRHTIYGVRCIHMLFNPVALVLGPDESRKQLMSIIQSTLNPERTTAHQWRCFSRQFIIQLIARFTLARFLHAFPILLIEACSGFKDEFFTRIDSDDDTHSASDSNTDTDETSTERTDTSIGQDYHVNSIEVNNKYIHSIVFVHVI
jgi:hypothetical protein